MHVDPTLIPLIKINNDDKLDKYFITIELHRGTTSQKSDTYGLKTDLFDNGDLEEFLLFIWNFNMTLEASGTLKGGTKIQYLRTLARG